jgi:N-hydroxyarylamine O-acetyltransferase
MSLELDQYFHRIGWAGPVRPDLDTLAALAAHHAAAIPFENLNPLLGLPVDLSAGALWQKIVQEGRGGYCFEQNLLFGRVLDAIGFATSGLAARVLWGRPEDAITPRSHMLLRVELSGASYLADVGFGGLVLTGALKLEPEIVQRTAHEPFRLVMVDGDWRMQARIGDEWRSLYRFDLQRQHPPDYEVANFFTSTYPRALMVTSLIAARALPGRRLALSNREFTTHDLAGETRRRRLKAAEEICAVLVDEFGLRLPDVPNLAKRLDALP